MLARKVYDKTLNGKIFYIFCLKLRMEFGLSGKTKHAHR